MMAEQRAGEREFKPNVVARVANGPYTLLVTGDSYEEIIKAAEDWVADHEGQYFTPTHYADLTSVKARGVIGVLDEEDCLGDDS